MGSHGSDREVIDGVGERLKGFRQTLGMTLAGLAARTGVSASTISRLERGIVRPSLEQLLSLSREFRVPLDELVAAPRVGDPRVHLSPFTRHGLTFIPLGVQAGGLQAFKVIYPVGDQRTHLRSGEAAEFATMTPHWIANASADSPAEIIAIYSHEGERVHLADV